MDGVFRHPDAQVIEVGRRQVHLDETQVHILAALLFRVIVRPTVGGGGKEEGEREREGREREEVEEREKGEGKRGRKGEEGKMEWSA